MRLLQVDENGEFSLTDDLINIPPYAILSHTWGEDHEEVNFKDLTIGPRKTKSGYRKLRFCAQQAARDGLQHFWKLTTNFDIVKSSGDSIRKDRDERKQKREKREKEEQEAKEKEEKEAREKGKEK
ncbi:hypothetical protein G7Y89_g6929 [Cudoniella acicularis]|uniref:Uncharacterized protein n=1 Tax=Cudoniella acicularis TaxID=354080 RepID=A0A8H4RL26_9HELO|nr:hypothetical protein G7Y89_g6929 [Cudoniella acicularis]